MGIYGLFSVVLVGVSYLTGHLLMSFGREEEAGAPFAYAFRRLSLGVLLLVTLYAVAHCAGKSVLVGIIPLLIAGARFHPPRLKGLGVNPAAATLFCTVFAALLAFQYLIGRDTAGNLYAVHPDYSFLAALADYVSGSGIESVNMELWYPGLQSPGIYHWFDIHFIALVGQVTPNYLNALLFVVIPFSGALSATGIAAAIEKYCGTTAWFTGLFACLALLMPVLSFNYMNGKVLWNAIDYHNIIACKVFLMISVVAWIVLQKNKSLPIAIGGVALLTAAPALFAGAFIDLAVRFPVGRRTRVYWQEAAVLCCSVIWVAAFYAFSAKENPYFVHHLSMPAQIGEAFRSGSWRDIGQYAGLFTGNILLGAAPCLLLALFLGRSGRRTVAGFIARNRVLLLSLASGLILACVMWFSRDALQLATEVSVAAEFVVQALLLALLFTGGRSKSVVATVAVATGLLSIVGLNKSFRGNRLSDDFYHRLASIEEPVAWTGGESRADLGDAYARDANYTVPFANVRRLRNGYFPVRLDVYDIVYDADDMRDYGILASIENSTFYRWTESKGIPMKRLREAQNDFIRENGIRYVIVPFGEDWLRGRGFTIEERFDSPGRKYTIYKISRHEDSVQ